MKAIVFDLYNTLVWSPGFATVMERILPGVTYSKISGMVYAEREGSSEAMVRRIARIFELALTDDAVRQAVEAFDVWAEERPFYPHTQETLRELRKRGFALALLSNTSELLDRTVEVTGLHRYFDYLGLSHVMGLRKPDPRAFRWVMQQLGLPPEEATMVGDDWDLDVMGAKGIGMEGIQIHRPWKKAGSRIVTSIEQLLDLPEFQRPA